MRLCSDLSLSAQTAYAQVLDAALAAEVMRSVADLPGSFAAKIVKGRKYWYFQYTEPSGRLRQVYVGPDSEPVHRLMRRQAGESARDSLSALARAAIALGCADLLPRHFRVIRRLADYGFFRAGGVLIGTHAFLAYGNMLGVTWGGSARTQDIYLAHAGKSVSLLLPSTIEVDTGAAIESLNMGFLPVSSLASKVGPAYLNPREPDFRIDFLTTMHRGGERPYKHRQLHITMQPLKFMEFSLEDVQQVALLSADGAVVVNVPHPARFALHKLIVYGERAGSYATKSAKDLSQAAHLLAYLGAHREHELGIAWADLLSRGKNWVTRVERGLTALDKAFPQLEARKSLRIRAGVRSSSTRRRDSAG